MNLRSCFTILLLVTSSVIGVSGQTDQMKERILSQDYHVAQKALEENVEKRDVKAICLSLKHRAMSLKTEAAIALGSIGSKESINCLTEALEGNLAAMRGPGNSNSESRASSDELNKSLIEALKAVTGLKLPVKKKYSDSEVEKVIARIKEWQKTQQNR